jgi:hypothetical protein
MAGEPWPVGVPVAGDIEYRKGVTQDVYRARVRWKDSFTNRRRSLSQA